MRVDRRRRPRDWRAGGQLGSNETLVSIVVCKVRPLSVMIWSDGRNDISFTATDGVPRSEEKKSPQCCCSVAADSTLRK